MITLPGILPGLYLKNIEIFGIDISKKSSRDQMVRILFSYAYYCRCDY